ncbi:BTAD domain-containing putative transcriptional regulator [Actinocrispum wychmicini]|uniref:BTAD domain-containing putative transcriptional regulator n=1 Tax=Actinocrispum wychmicini TaxID=1213861 RepID=UPI001A9CD073|nr:BTAD domain-containing putative transcriptional regulator [Actinocrispum wychmicini]
MRFSILGTVEVRSDNGDELPLGGPRQRALLALLLVDAGRIVTFERLIDGLYGDQPPAGAANALQSQVSRLRRTLPGVISFHPTGYRIDVDPMDVDVHRFEDLARHHDVTHLRAALDLWRGPLELPVDTAARLVELRLSAEEDLFEARLALGENVVPEVRAKVAEYPLRERLRGQLMRALYAAGRQAEALAEFEDARRLLATELGADPTAELAATHLAVLRGETRPSLPAQLTSFVGRHDERGRITRLLNESRLVTIVGPGGVGKTRIAIEVAPPDTCFVDLSTVDGDVAQAVLSALGVRDAGLFPSAGGTPDAGTRVLAALADRRLLLVLDNCEHVVNEAARLSRAVLTGCPGTRILATSREALGITGEYLCPLPPLGPAEAARLFADRARAVSPGFAESSATVRRVCAALDGLPLAIELAAARLRTLTLDEIADRLDDRFRLLSRGDRTAPPRHRTLRAVVEWSWDLLADDEQLLAGQLTVFAGGATFETVTAVCDSAAPLPDLVDRSLVENVGGRYRMLETIRAFCAAQFDLEPLRRRHAVYFHELAEQAAPELRRAAQLVWMSRLDSEQANLRAALTWAIDADVALALRLVGALSQYWYLRGLRDEVAPLAAALLERVGTEPPDELDEEYVLCVVYAAWGRTDAPERETHLKLSESFMDASRGPLRRPFTAYLWAATTGPPKGASQRALASDDLWSESFTVLGNGILHLYDGSTEAADRECTRALAGFRAIGDRWAMAIALNILAALTDARGDKRFLPLVEEALRLVAELDSVEDTASLLRRRGHHFARHGDLDAAESDFARVVASARQAGVPEFLADGYWGLGEVARFRGDLGEALRLQELALATCTHGPYTTGEARARILVALGRLAEEDGDMDQARSRFDLAVTVALASRNMPNAAASAEGLAGVALRDGDAELAATLLGAAVALRGTALAGDPDVESVSSKARASLGAGYGTAFDRGASLARDEALTLLGQRVP